MWIYKASRVFIAGTNQIISRTEDKLHSSNKLCPSKTLHAIYGPRLRRNYLCGCPVYHNCISTSTELKQFSRSKANNGLQSQPNCNGNTNQSICIYQNKNSPLMPSLLTLSELELLCISHKYENSDYINNINSTSHRSTCSLTIGHNECRCTLCINKRKLIESSVLKAKVFIDEKVLMTQCNEENLFISKYKFYLLYLAHFALAVAYLRGMI